MQSMIHTRVRKKIKFVTIRRSLRMQKLSLDMDVILPGLECAECHYSNEKHCHAMLFWKPLALFWLDSLSDHSSLQRNINCGYRLICYCN